MFDKALAEKLTQVALKQLDASTRHKQPRMDRLKEYENLYAGNLRPKLRQQFNVALPVFSGLIDTLAADFDDPIQLTFREQDPADYRIVKKIEAAFKVDFSRPDAKWDLKNRWEKNMALISGRGIKRFWSDSDPKYKANLEVVDYASFHCEPKGGGHLENHLFCGEENIFKTKAQLLRGVKAGIYDPEAVMTLLERAASEDYKVEAEEAHKNAFARFRALGIETEGNDYVGVPVYNLVQWAMTHTDGKRYYLLFDPWTKTGIRCEPLKDVVDSDLYPYVSYATHENAKVFWSKSYADDFYPVAMAIIELLNQELTNRQKKNMGAKAYDRDMYYDVAKLDAAQYRPDALVPVKVPPGKKIQDGIFMFETPELQGTVTIINWLESEVTNETGVGDLNQKGGTRNANVVFAKLQQAQKRIGHKAKSYTEAWGEIGVRYVIGLQHNLTEPMAIQMLGKNGLEWEELVHSELELKRDFAVKVISTIEQDKDNVLGKDQKTKALELIGSSEVLQQAISPQWQAEQILRDIGGYSDEVIQEAMDVQNFGSKDLLSQADAAINAIIRGKKAELNYDANTVFMQKILDYARDHKQALGDKYDKMVEYVLQHQIIATENTARLALKLKTIQAVKGTGGSVDSSGQAQTEGAGDNAVAPQNSPISGQNPISRQNPVPVVKREPMSV